jgi:ParB family chromosome partitioning protein
MTDTLATVLDLPVAALAPHPRNVRRSLGDLKDLTRSIRDRGVETPLVVLPADGAGVHHIVAGHRRRAAAEAAGLATVPCIVREFTDEADEVLAMIAENTQRLDGLNVVDEAQALAAVIDLRGGTVTARKLAAAVGHSEGWVRTRLGLLVLPDSALDALHAGTITLDVATALIPLAEHIELVEQLVARRGLSVWQIESSHRELLADAALADATAALDAAGVTAVTEADWRENQRSWKSLDDLGIAAEEHHDEPCHAVVLSCRRDATVVEMPICTEPRRHRGRNPDSALTVAPVEPTPAELAERADRKERRQATTTRQAWVAERLRGRPIAASEAFPLTVATWIDSAPCAVVKHAVELLGVETPDHGYPDYSALLHGAVVDDPKRLATVALALVAATAEDRARQSLRTTTAARYLDAIERLGYQPTDWEHTQRLTAA